MQANLHTVAFRGIETLSVSVQVHMASGLPSMQIVGLADKAVTESRERVRAALSSMGLALPPKRIAVNLSPADVAKEGAHFDLPIALAILVAMGALPTDLTEDALVMGELSLDGSILPVAGVLPAAIAAAAENLRLICPAANGPEAVWAEGRDIVAAPSLPALINHLRGHQLLPAPVQKPVSQRRRVRDMAELKGQETARRALEIAAAGGHNLLMIGPPGAGKSMLAARLPGLLPPLTAEESLEVTMIHSLVGEVPPDEGLVTERPFREPHHSASMAALVGGGQKARPGEISLSHRGVLFLDELAEFARPALDSLRQPMETGEVVIARANNHIRYPAQFQLIAAMNPCRCGYLSDPARACSRAPDCGRTYMSRVSGPMLDRFDIILDIEELSADQLLDNSQAEPSAPIQARILAAREKMAQRRSTEDMPLINARLSPDQLDRQLAISEDALALLKKALDQQKLSARAYHKILRVAASIRDLAAAEEIDTLHMAEAISYRLRPLQA